MVVPTKESFGIQEAWQNWDVHWYSDRPNRTSRKTREKN